MAGVIGRSGRKPKRIEDWYKDIVATTFRQAHLLLNDDSVPLLDRVRACLPLAVKYVPERVEQININIQATQDDLANLSRLAEINSRQIISSHIVKPAESERLAHNDIDVKNNNEE